MNNRIKLSTEFCFKGQYLQATLELVLDELMTRHGELPDFYPLLAEANNIGFYSYEYEVMLLEDILVEPLSGWVDDWVNDGQLDKEGFEKQWHQQSTRQQLQQIAVAELGETLAADPRILSVLLQAHALGKEAGMAESRLLGLASPVGF